MRELEKGWTCPHCGFDHANRAGVQGLRRRPLRWLLYCMQCDKPSDAAEEGVAAFEALFGDLLREFYRWNPRANDLEWDGS